MLGCAGFAATILCDIPRRSKMPCRLCRYTSTCSMQQNPALWHTLAVLCQGPLACAGTFATASDDPATHLAFHSQTLRLLVSCTRSSHVAIATLWQALKRCMHFTVLQFLETQNICMLHTVNALGPDCCIVPQTPNLSPDHQRYIRRRALPS